MINTEVIKEIFNSKPSESMQHKIRNQAKSTTACMLG